MCTNTYTDRAANLQKIQIAKITLLHELMYGWSAERFLDIILLPMNKLTIYRHLARDSSEKGMALGTQFCLVISLSSPIGPCHGSRCYLPASYCGRPGSNPGQFMWDL
jgi:hypothetical protein